MVKKVPNPVAILQWCDDRHYVLTDAEVSDINKDCRIVLTGDQRQNIQNFLLAHVTQAEKELHAPKYVDTMRASDQLKKSTEALIENIEDLLRHPGFNKHQVVWWSILEAGFSNDDLGRLLQHLTIFRKRCDEAKRILEKAAYGGPGPQTHPHLERFVMNLTDVFEAAGGTVSAAFSPNSRNKPHRGTPFVRFVFRLTQKMPSELHIAKGALGEAINRTLMRRRKKQKHCVGPKG